jgi:calcineurin-like phosphoesterase family protein
MSKNIWFTSDPHYMHRNIAGPKVSKWGGGYRDFDDEKIMSDHIVKVWNETVKEDDVLYCLGDWSFGGIDNIWNFRKQLNVKIIHFIIGNHDEKIIENKVLPNCFYQIDHQGNHYLTSDKTDRSVHAKDLFETVQTVLNVSHGKHNFFLSHYSHRVWEANHHGVIHLYGHSHDSIDKNGEHWGKSMDVGIDAAKRLLGEYRPFSIEEIINIMDKREIKAIDHHK